MPSRSRPATTCKRKRPTASTIISSNSSRRERQSELLHAFAMTTGGTAMQRPALGLAMVLLCSVSAFSQQPQRQTALREIIPGHYVFSSGTFNSGLIVTSDGVVVLDALNSESVGKAEREAIANTIPHPVRPLGSSPFH